MRHTDALPIRRGLAIAILFALFALPLTGHAQGPSFDCTRAEKGSIEADICENPDLAALDRELATVYAQATRKAARQHPPTLAAEQRGWIKGRDDCWKSANRIACIEDSYRLRIAELQASYELTPRHGPFWYSCDDAPGSEVVVTFFETTPKTLRAERGDSTSLMFMMGAEGTTYNGRNETFAENGTTATVTWGYNAPPLHCTRK